MGKKTNAGKCGLTTLILIIGECWGGGVLCLYVNAVWLL